MAIARLYTPIDDQYAHFQVPNHVNLDFYYRNYSLLKEPMATQVARLHLGVTV